MALDEITKVTGSAVYVPGNDIDTDRIIPARFMKCVTFDGLGEHLFHDVRKDEDGRDRDHPLNDERFSAASILISNANFGCGSSREHAPWALEDFGFKVVIAPSFADIFYNNAFKNGILLVTLAEEEVDRLFAEVEANEGYQLDIDLEHQRVITPSGEILEFEVDAFRKHCLLNGLDDIGITLQDEDAIRSFEEKHRQQRPWLFRQPA